MPSDSVQVHGQPEGIKLKMRECKLRSGVNWQWMLKREMHKVKGHKTRVMCMLSFFRFFSIFESACLSGCLLLITTGLICGCF